MYSSRKDSFSLKRDRGFALVIALSLMAFVLLLLLTISTLVRVESRSAAVHLVSMEARQNALLGAYMALGHSQKLTGPDQRVTARADILEKPDDWIGAQPEVRNPYWTGVWRQETSGVPSSTNPHPRPAPELMTWLVSGMDNVASADLASKVTEGLQSNGADLGLLDANGLAQLVRPNDSTMDGGVVAPKVLFEDGAYAYWIADESLKANVALSDPYADAAESSSAGRLRLNAAQRFGAERIGVSSLNQGNQASFGTNYQSIVGKSELARLIDIEGLAVIAPDPSAMETYIRQHIHDISAQSMGLMANPWRGGLQTDLSRGLDDDALSGNLRDDFSPIWDDKPIPQWELFASYYNSYQGQSGFGVEVRPGSNVQNGYSPIILGFNILNGLHLEPLGVNASTGEDEWQVYFTVWLGFAMWNPYNVPLRDETYVFDVNPVAYSARYSIDGLPVADGGSGIEFQLNFKNNVVLATGQGPGYTNPELERASERIRVATRTPISFDPGEIKILSSQPIGDYKIGPNSADTLASLPDAAKCIDLGYREEDYILLGVESVAQRSGGSIDANGDGDFGDVVTIEGPSGTKEIDEDRWDGVLTQALIENGALGAYEGTYKPLYFLQSGNPGMMVSNASGQKLHSVSSAYGGSWSQNPVSIVPGGYMGIYGSFSTPNNPKRNNTARILADTNIRMNGPASMVGRREDGHPFRFIGGVSWNSSPATAGVLSWVPTGAGATNSFWGMSDAESFGGQDAVVLFDAPREPLVSIGQFQHLNLRPNSYQIPLSSIETLTSEKYNRTDSQVPTYQVGNSRVNMWTEVDRKDFVYRVNEALWDDYFFSSIPSNVSDWSDPFLNKRMTLIGFDESSDLSVMRSRATAASKLAVTGPFNVNSTSVEAWKAALSSLGGLLENPDTATDFIATFPGFENTALLDGFESNSFGLANYQRIFKGFRGLTEAELEVLATRIVEEVKVRGPFLSLAEFINRTPSGDRDTRARELDNTGLNHGRFLVDQRDTRLKGTLQAAIDGADLNEDTLPDINEITREAATNTQYGSSYSALSGLPLAQGIVARDSLGAAPQQNGISANYPFDEKLNRPRDSFSGFNSNSEDITQNPWVAGYGLTTADAPGFLSQMDILTALGPSLKVRSDTFKVRSYGEARDPVSGDILGRAWLEMTLQRVPEYVDSTANDADDRGSSLTPLNARFGRRIKIESLRWLDDGEV